MENINEAAQACEIAKQCAEIMLKEDFCSDAMGIKLRHVGQGQSVMSMTVKKNMLNGHGSCHGGMLFTLGDSAFAVACNSENQVAVAAGCSIEYIRPAFEGDELTATAEAKSQGKTTGTYDIEIRNQKDQLVALFRGKSHRFGKNFISVPSE
ncbi:MAG: hydroxyphenylacetyl-CoA thioesterase PaaI [Vibrio sp.]